MVGKSLAAMAGDPNRTRGASLVDANSQVPNKLSLTPMPPAPWHLRAFQHMQLKINKQM